MKTKRAQTFTMAVLAGSMALSGVAGAFDAATTHPRTTRESRWGQILTAFGIALGLRIAGLTSGNLLTINPWAIVLVYGIPLGTIVVAAWTAHVRMSPELRSKLSLELKFKPKKIRFWADRGMQAT